jgi:hypothetical protein
MAVDNMKVDGLKLALGADCDFHGTDVTYCANWICDNCKCECKSSCCHATTSLLWRPQDARLLFKRKDAREAINRYNNEVTALHFHC